MSDARLYAPAFERNADPILDVLRKHLPANGLVLEIASGTGQHVTHFAASLPGLEWQPSDKAAECRASIDAWAAELKNVRPALDLDASAEPWAVERADAVLCINMIHISPWASARGLFGGAARLLSPGGVCALYGPYRWRGREMEPGNAAFDADLRARDPRWGLREVEEVEALGATNGFTLSRVENMPVDNLTLIFRRGG